MSKLYLYSWVISLGYIVVIVEVLMPKPFRKLFLLHHPLHNQRPIYDYCNWATMIHMQHILTIIVHIMKFTQWSILHPGKMKRCNIGVNKWLIDKKIILKYLLAVPGQKLIIQFGTPIAVLLKKLGIIKISLFLPPELQNMTQIPD